MRARVWLLLTMMFLGVVPTVPAGATGPTFITCTMQWTEPVLKLDTTLLTDLAAFNIYFSPTPGGLGVPVGTLAAPAPTPLVGTVYTWPCPAGVTGQQYATVTAVSQGTGESPRSNEVAFVLGQVVPPPPPPPPPAGPTLTAAPSTILRGQSALLTLSLPTTNYHNVFLNGVRPACTYTAVIVCTLSVAPTSTTIYQAAATDQAGTPYPMPQVTVTVTQPPPPPAPPSVDLTRGAGLRITIDGKVSGPGPASSGTPTITIKRGSGVTIMIDGVVVP